MTLRLGLPAAKKPVSVAPGDVIAGPGQFLEGRGKLSRMALAGARILQVIPNLDAGGAERTTVEVAAALKAAGATALVASGGGRLSRELEAAGAELVEMPNAGSKNP